MVIEYKEEKELEQRLQDEDLNAPRIKPADVDGMICDCKYFQDDTLVICVLTLPNGHKVVGTSRPVSDANFKLEVGKEVAFKNAREHIWELAGYDLRSKLQREVLIGDPPLADLSTQDA